MTPGWPQSIQDIYDEAVRRLGGRSAALHFGPAHVVWEDDNFEFAADCLADFESHTGTWCEADLAVVRWSLEELAKHPIDF